MNAVTYGYVASSALLVVAGMVMVGLALRAYRETLRTAMVHLSVGFALVVAATASTSISALTTGFAPARSLLLVNNGLASAGYLFIVYSLVSYE
jgi:hypothetical protein